MLGIIGRNGAGKSTLLKILSRITKPTSGRADIYGRVGSLLEVGTGFHPELTGRENIFLNGAILGMTRREIQKRFDEIVAFAEVEQFLDTPVKRYSSGMYMRLAFAVAAHLEPEVLIVDEVLAVGDAEFQKKCLGKMGDVAKSGRTVLFVSHNMAAVISLCSKAVLLNDGYIAFEGETAETVSQYMRQATYSGFVRNLVSTPGAKMHMQQVSLQKDGKPSTFFRNSEMLVVQIEFEVFQDISNAQVALELITLADECVFSTTSQDVENQLSALTSGKYLFECPIDLRILREGQYSILVTSSIPGVEMLDSVKQELVFDLVDDVSPILKLGQNRRGIILPTISWNTERLS